MFGRASTWAVSARRPAPPRMSASSGLATRCSSVPSVSSSCARSANGESSRVHLYACVREALLSNEALARVFLALRLDRAGGGTGEVKARADVVEALAAHLFLELSERQDSEVRLDALLEAICDGGARVAAQSYRGSAKRSDASCRFTPIGRVGNDFGILESVQDVASDTDVSESDENACVADILREKAWEEAERAKLPAQRAADDRRYLRAPRTAAAPARIQ